MTTTKKQTRTARYRDLDCAPIREQVAAKHRIGPDDHPMIVTARLVKLARARRVDPQVLTPVNAAAIREFLGLAVKQWEWLMAEESNPPYGPPPPPRVAGGTRGRGIEGLWLLELDVFGWLGRTGAGRALLEGVVAEIVEGRVRPDGAGGYVRSVDVTT